MTKPKPDGPLAGDQLTVEDVARFFGDIESATLLAILELRPTGADLEEVALRLAGNGEAVGRRHATGVVAEILDLLDTGDEEDRGPVAGRPPG